ncbi:MAG: hypothetical protein ACYC1C_15825 [Chloroflexota bacterium]
MAKEKTRFGLTGGQWLAVVAVLTLSGYLTLSPGLRAADGAEVGLSASVTVLDPTDAAYGLTVEEAHRCYRGEDALGEPDGAGAWLLNGGRLVIELERTVTDCGQVGIWLATTGWGDPGLSVFVSEDGRRWQPAGGRTSVAGLDRLHMTGDYGPVRYVRLTRTGSWFSVVFVDAIRAQGG